VARTYDDEVDVRTSAAADAAGGPGGGRTGGGGERPEAFVWHGRLHVVRAVLGRWYERRAWWEQDPQREEGAPALAAAPATAGAAGRAGAAPGSRSPRRSGVPSLDREVWQVEASAGRTAGCGVYELCREDPAAPGGWSLRRVDD